MLSQRVTDNYIVFAVMLQSALALLQQVLVSVFNMPEVAATTFRVMLTAIPLSIAIIIAAYRRIFLFIGVYAVAIIVLAYHYMIFPENRPFMMADSMRFTLPVVIPSALCLMVVSSAKTVDRVLYYISWVSFALCLFYALCLFAGVLHFENYSMSFSYALLLPMVSLYSEKKWYSIAAAFFILFMIVAIGSRGAAGSFAIYLIYDIFQNNKKGAIILTAMALLLFVSIQPIAEFLSNEGIQSRTLNLLISGELLSHDSGREYIQNIVLQAFWKDPICGLGLWGDRPLIGIYSHNIIIELYAHFGIIIASIIIVTFCYIVIKLFVKLDKENRNTLVKYVVAFITPLVFSGSYLTSYGLASLFGIIYLLYKTANNNYT